MREELLREYMDYSDLNTVKQMSLLTEANQNQFLVSLTSKLYDKIQEKATKIDFSTVELSRGDITRIQNYDSMMECLQLIRRIVIEYKQDPAAVDVVIRANENLRERVRTFKKGFALGSSLPILVYNTMSLAIVEATSFLISVCIEYVKDPAMDTFNMALDVTAYNKTKQNLLFNTLIEFNKACADKSMDNALNTIMSQVVVNREAADLAEYNDAKIEKDHPFLTDEEIESGSTVVVHDCDKKPVQEGNIATAIGYAATHALLWILKKLIPLIRAIVYWFFSSKQKMSDYYADQADMLEMNALELRSRTDLSEAEKKEIFRKQMKIVEKFRKKANEMSIDYTVAKKNADRMANDEAKKFKADEIDMDNYSGYASIFEAEMNSDLGEFVFESPFKVATIEERVNEN